MKNLAKLSLIAVCAASLAQAQTTKTLPELFKAMNNYRGPMGKNVIQGTGGRAITPSSPGGKRLFQGIFRSNDSGRRMAREYDFYVGNLFSSNYYELVETYVWGIESNNAQNDTASYNPARELDHVALLAKAPEAMPRASSMIRHWVLEKYYVSKFPQSTLALAFQRWGVGDSADEQRFASAFFNFYLSSMTTDLQYLPAYLLIRQSPVGDSAKSPSLQKARDLVADYPNQRDTLLGRIRNVIHNQLSPIAIDMIDQYRRENGSLPEALVKVRAILVAFFSFSPEKSAIIAGRLGLTEYERIAKVLAADEKAGHISSLADMLAFSAEAAVLKSSVTTMSVTPENKADALLLLSYTAQFLNSRLTNDKWYTPAQLASKEAVATILNSVYIEGLLIKRNWEFFSNKVSGATDAAQLSALLGQATKIGTDTLIKAFAPSFDQWKMIEAKMEGFTDNIVKSSSLNTASVVLQKIGK